MTVVHGCDYLEVKDCYFTVYGAQEYYEEIRGILTFYPTDGEEGSGKRADYTQLHVNDPDAEYALRQCSSVNEDDTFQGIQHVQAENVDAVYSTTDILQEDLASVDSPVYRKYIRELQNVGVPIEDIGIGGSQLIGLSHRQSDHDLVVRGVDNMKTIKKNFNHLQEEMSMSPVPKKRRDEKVEQYGKRYDLPR